ncbi:hypothetical protein [Halorubrum sp. ASP1]|uniref:hypothetical protein n=1 Tax=Halorubrum sp. ASP1 TaxID=2518114 RepID=UPI0013053ED5|nr:hypothetical protein [Halorubrum sp. ASP1]
MTSVCVEVVNALVFTEPVQELAGGRSADLHRLPGLEVPIDGHESDFPVVIGLSAVEQRPAVDTERDAAHPLAVDGDRLGDLLERQESIADDGVDIGILNFVEATETLPELSVVMSVPRDVIPAVRDVASDLGPGETVALFAIAVTALTEAVFVDGTDLGNERSMRA